MGRHSRGVKKTRSDLIDRVAYPRSSQVAQTEGGVIHNWGLVQPSVAEILTGLPYTTPWANDHIDP